MLCSGVCGCGLSAQIGRKGCRASGHRFASFNLPDDDRAFGLRLVEYLTVQTIYTFVRVNLARGVDCLDGTFYGADLTGMSTLMIALEPVEHPDASGDGERCAEWTQIAAIEAFDEQPRDDHRCCIDDERPGTDELEYDRCLEGFDLGQILRLLD